METGELHRKATLVALMLLLILHCTVVLLVALIPLEKTTIISNGAPVKYRKEIDDHRETLQQGKPPRDYIDSFLLECERLEEAADKEEPDTFTEQMLAGNVQGFLAAGIETVRTTLSWAMLILATHQNVQQRVFLEVSHVCGTGKVNWAKRGEMGFTQATIFEIERWKTISPLNLMRQTTADTTLGGFAIAKGTHVIANLWAVHFDPKYWRNPNQFEPARFLGIDGQLIKSPQFIPFSIG